LLTAARAAEAWLAAGLTVHPAPHLALFAAAALLARSGPIAAVFLPVWAAYPTVGFGDRDALPTLRTDAATRVAGQGLPVRWPLVFLHLVAESARAGLRELDRLEVAAEKGRGVIDGCDKRARLPDALDALLRAPALTPKALAGRLKVAPQTGTAVLRELEGRRVVREVTGRGSFRAFAI
jgi:HTH DNA binding domain